METSTDPQKATVVTDGKPPKRGGLFAAAVLAGLVFLGGTAYYLKTHTIGDAPVSQLAAAQVEITSKGFSPATVKLKQGQQLTWLNGDAAPHQISGADTTIGELQSDTAISPEDSLTATMEHRGTFTYYDSLNNTDFKGTIIVE